MSKNGNNLYESFQETWRDQSDLMTKQFLGLSEKGESAAEGVYWSWLEFNKRFKDEIGRLATGNNTDHDDLTNIYSEFNDRMANILTTSMDENKTTYENFSKNWSEFANNLRENMETFFQEHEKELENIRNVYQNQVETINTRVASVFKTISSDYEKMFRSYLERTANFQENFGIFTVSRVQSFQTEMDDLRKKVKQLEDKLKKIEK
jgi:methyl-accepting chemotaxis protein